MGCLALATGLLFGCGNSENVTVTANFFENSTEISSVDTSYSGSESTESTERIIQENSNGPRVFVTFLKENGKTVKEEYAFSGNLDFLSSCPNVWTMDLHGQIITLDGPMRVLTEGTIENGTLITSKENHIINEGRLTLGPVDAEGGLLLLQTEGVGVENNGELILGYAALSVKSGRGIINKKSLTAVREDKEPHVKYSTNGGVILENEGEAVLFAADIEGTAETFIINNNKLTLFGTDFEGMGGVYVLNEPDRELALIDCSFTVDHDGEIAVKNHGIVKKAKSSDFEGLAPRSHATASFLVYDGTAIENSGEWHAQGKINIKRGVGFHNKAIKEFTNEFEWIFIDEEGGVGLLNEGIFGYVKINCKGGTAIENSGNLMGEVRVNAVADNYKGNLIDNEATGTVSADVYINSGCLTEAKLIDNQGVFDGKGLYRNKSFVIYGGMRVAEITDWFSEEALSNVTYGIVFDGSNLNSSLIANSGKIRDYNLQAYAFGTGEEFRVLAADPDTENNFTGEALVVVCGTGITAFDIGEGAILNFEYAEFTTDTSYIFPIEGITFDKAEAEMPVSDILLLDNKGIVGLTKSQSRLYFCLKGSRVTGFENKGYIEGYELLIEVGGEENTGFINRELPETDRGRSVHLDTLTSKVIEIGGNKGTVNEGSMYVNYLSASVCTEENTEDSMGRQDVAFANGDKGLVECAECVAASCNNSNCVGLENFHILKCGKQLTVSAIHGIAMICEKKSFTSTEKFSADLTAAEGDATGLVVYDLVEVTDYLDITVKGEGNYGVLIMAGANLSQNFDGEFAGAGLYTQNQGHAIVNEGRLNLERPYFTKEPEADWSELLSGKGKFNYTWLLPKSYYDEGGDLIGPWKGIGYGIATP